MGRSSSVNSTNKRRKSLRFRNLETEQQPATEANENAAASSEEASSKVQSSNDGPSRRPRRRSGNADNRQPCEDYVNQKPAAAISATAASNKRNTATRSGKKRASSAASSSSEEQEERQTKRTKNHATFSVARKYNRLDATATMDRPWTRSRRKLTISNQVTPSPTPAGGLVFDFDSPLAQKETPVPRGVINLYPSKSSTSATLKPCGLCGCNCEVEHCSSKALTASYVQSYGEEYWQHLKDDEEPIVVPPPSPDTSVSRSSYTSSPKSTCDDSVFTYHTPEYKRNWTLMNMERIEGKQPKESTRFLHYQPELTPKMRSILVDWLIELSEHFHFGPATLHLAITLVDKVLACGPLSMDDDDDWNDDHEYDDYESKTNCYLISRERFQLLGATCTWLACKVEEQSPPNVSEIAYVSDHIYSSEQIKRMERRICTALNFSLIHSTPFLFLPEFIRASDECPNPRCGFPFSSVFHQLVNYLLEIGRLPYEPVTKKPSLLAAGAVYLARVTLDVRSADTSIDPEGRWTRTLQYYTGYSKSDLEDTVKAIHAYQLGAEESNLKSVYTKYKSKKYGRIALKTVPLEENLGF